MWMPSSHAENKDGVPQNVSDKCVLNSRSLLWKWRAFWCDIQQTTAILKIVALTHDRGLLGFLRDLTKDDNVTKSRLFAKCTLCCSGSWCVTAPTSPPWSPRSTSAASCSEGSSSEASRTGSESLLFFYSVRSSRSQNVCVCGQTLYRVLNLRLSEISLCDLLQKDGA